MTSFYWLNWPFFASGGGFVTRCRQNPRTASGAQLPQALQQAIVDKCQWLQVAAPGLEVSQLLYTPHALAEELGAPAFGRAAPEHEAQRGGGVPGKTLSLFADDPDLQGWR